MNIFEATSLAGEGSLSKIWFITGASRGFGRELATVALERGDRVAAAARDPSRLDDLLQRFGEALLPLPLDVCDAAAVGPALEAARERFGRIDVVVNNAGSGLSGAIEEVSEEEARAVMETNFFGLFRVSRATVSLFRTQGFGHLLQIGSIAGLVVWPLSGLYVASKFAVEGLSEAIALETAGMGIHVTIVEPGIMATGFGNVAARSLPAYDAVRAAKKQAIAESMALLGVRESALSLLPVVDAPEPPLRFLVGALLDRVRGDYEARLRTWESWATLSATAQAS